MVKILSLALVGLLMLSASASASDITTLEPVVVTATKIETPTREIASSVTVISRKEIENKQTNTVEEVLRSVPGLDVVRQGGLGQQTSVFLRGANSAHTLVLIDGIEANDPSAVGRAFDFSSLSTDNIERIEIVRGPGSTLYGSDAIGGVINIITHKGSGAPSATLFAEGGSFETHQEKLTVSGGTDLINYSLTFSSLESNGISSLSKESGGSERDGYDRKSISTRIGLTPLDNFDLDFYLRYLDAESDRDGWGTDDPNTTSNSESLFFRTQARLLLLNDAWEQKLGFSLTDYDRLDLNKPDSSDPISSNRTTYDSRLYKVDWQHNFYLHPSNTLTLGFEYEKEEAKSRDARTYLDWDTFTPTSSLSILEKKTAETTGYYVQEQIKLGQSSITTLGMRVDNHNQFGTRLTYRITSSYNFPTLGTRLKGTYGTAFKAPTLAQLYENTALSIGNPDLSPEKSHGWDIGLEQNLWNERLMLGITYFQNQFEDLIIGYQVDPDIDQYGYENIDEAITSGIELTAVGRPLEDLTVSANYTYTDTEDRKTGKQLLRRPRHKYNINIDYRFLKRGDINLDIFYVGERNEFGNLKLAPYTVVNLALSYKINKHIRLHGRIENLFDEQYEESTGFGTPGIAGYAGASLTF